MNRRRSKEIAQGVGGAGLDRTALSLFEVLPLGIVITDDAGKIVESNRAAEEMLGLDPNADGIERSGYRFLRADGSILPAAEYPSARALHEDRVLADQQIGVAGPDGETTWFQVTATPLHGVGVVTTYHDVTRGRQAEEDLRHHIDQLDAFFETNLDLLAILNSDGQAVRLNPAWGRLLGYDSEQLDGARLLDFVHPSDMETTMGALARMQTRNEVVEFINRVHHRNGNYRFLEWRATASGDLIYATARDTTEQRLAEAALRESEARFRAIFEQAAVGVGEVDGDTGRFIQVNQRFCDIVGYRQEELVTRTFQSITHPEDRPKDLVRLRQLHAGEIEEDTFEKRYVHKDGHIVWINIQVRNLSRTEKTPARKVTVIEDITERKETDELLRKSLADVLYANQRLNFQVTRMPLAYIAWDLEFRITEWNPSAERIFGWPASEAMGKRAYDLLVPPDGRPAAAKVWGAVVEGSDINSQAVLDNCTRDGRRIVCEWFNTPYVDTGGQIVGGLSMAHDITDRLRVEEKVLRSQRMQSLGSFAGGVAYDISSATRAIMGVASSLQSGMPDAETLRRGMGSILQTCARGRTLVRGLLDFARQDLADAKVFDLNQILEEQLRLLGRSMPPNVRVERELDVRLRPVTGDSFALGGAFMHLLMNAMDAMPMGGLLTVRTQMRGDEEVEIDVEDTGGGMSKVVLDQAMEPFFTTKPPGKGIGLGLPSVYGAVKAHQGSMEIHSEPGRGTQVRIALPVSPAASKHSDAPQGKPPEAHGLRILLVDDDDLVLTAVSAQLRRLGHRVATADNGQEALDKIQEGLEVDLVLLDIEMPVLDGGKTLPRLRQLRPNLPVIIETGSMGDCAEQLARTHADVSVLVRPFSLSELKAALDPWVERAGDSVRMH